MSQSKLDFLRDQLWSFIGVVLAFVFGTLGLFVAIFALSDPGREICAAISIVVIVLALIFFYLLVKKYYFNKDISRGDKVSSIGVGLLAFLLAALILKSAIATDTAFQNIFTQTTSGTPVLNDPLRDNSKGYNWQELKDSSSSCAFTGGAYQVTESQKGSFTTCNAESTNFFNFTLQVQMVIVKGDFGGILFRSDSTGSNAYIFGIYQDGSYYFTPVHNSNGQSPSKRGTSPAFKTGLNQTNLIAVVARETNFYLYINGQLVANVSDTSFGPGQIGVFAGDKFNPSDVAFSNLKIWQG